MKNDRERWRSDRRGSDRRRGPQRQTAKECGSGRPAGRGRQVQKRVGGNRYPHWHWHLSLSFPFFPFPSFLALGSWLGSLFSSACLLAFFVLYVDLFRRLVPVSLLLFPSLLFVSVARTFNSSKVLSPCSAHFTQHPSRLLQVSREVPPPPTVPPPILLSPRGRHARRETSSLNGVDELTPKRITLD